MFSSPTIPTLPALLTLATVGLFFSSCKEPPEPTDGEKEGRILGNALAKQIPGALSTRVPFRCNRTQKGTQLPDSLTRLGLTLADGVVSLPAKESKTVTIAFVSDSRGAHPQALTQTTRLSEHLAKEEIDLIVSVGGLGTEHADIKQVLSALSSQTKTPLLAFPGDRESVRDHRNAIDELANEERAIADGSTFPLIGIGPVLLAGLAGIPYASNLVAGDKGCIYDEQDLLQFQQRLVGDERKMVLTSYAPFAGLATARGPSGIELGPTWTQTIATDTTFTAIVHGMVGSSGPPLSGTIKAGSGPQAIVAGSLDPAEGVSGALLLSISPQQTTWRRIRLP